MLGNASGFSRPSFVVGDYAGGALIKIPAECPFRDGAAPCDVVLHSLRPRKTGPLQAVAVCHCHAHGRSFGVYPPGFVPYARRPLLDTPGAAMSFAAVAQEAAGGAAWARVAPGGTDRWWTTQKRLLRRLGQAIGGFAGSARDVVSVALGLPLHLLARVAEGVGFRALGRAVTDVIAAFNGDLDLLLLAGALAGAWGTPWRWHAGPARLAPLVPAHLADLAKRSTTSGPRAPPHSP